MWGGLAKTAIAFKGTHEKIQDHIDWLVKCCEDAGVTMLLDTEVTADYVAEQGPDVLVAATGGVRTVPQIAGVDSEIVAGGYLPEGDGTRDGARIAVVGGLGCEGVQVAIWLAKQGKQVTLIDELPDDDFGSIMPDWVGPQQKYYCQAHGIEILDGVTVEGISEEGVSVALSHDGLKRTVACDDVVLAYPVSPDASLVDAAGDLVSEAYAIGDCNEHGLIRDAVYAGNALARKL